MPEVVHLATGDGLLTLDCQGSEIGRDDADVNVSSIDDVDVGERHRQSPLDQPMAEAIPSGLRSLG